MATTYFSTPQASNTLRQTPQLSGGKSAWLDMGTSHFQVFLELQSKGPLPLKNAKTMAVEAAVRPLVDGGGSDQWIEIAKSKIGAAASYPELIEACRDPLSK